jgi:hypothetical protein
MSYQEEWGAISARIATLKEAATLRAGQHATVGRESFGLGAVMRAECQSIADVLQIYGERYENTLPSATTSAIKRLLSSRPIQGVRDNSLMTQNDRSIPEAVTALVMFAGELSYLVADQQPLLRLRSQQALAHLQRTLAVNKRVRGLRKIKVVARSEGSAVSNPRGRQRRGRLRLQRVDEGLSGHTQRS